MSIAAVQRPTQTDVAIIGAGPVGLFAAFQAGLLGLETQLVDTLPHPGGSCAALYPDQPIYDIPGQSMVTGGALIDQLVAQVAPFAPGMLLDTRVEHLARRADGRFELGTDTGRALIARAVIVAAGAGGFVPRRLTVPGLDSVSGSILADPRNLAPLAGHDVLVLGGGDGALESALALIGRAATVTLVHRAEAFRASPATVAAVNAAIAAGSLRFVAGDITRIEGLGALASVEVMTAQGPRCIPADRLVTHLGLDIALGPIASWPIEMAGPLIPVDPAGFQSTTPGLFAVGDIALYPGKLKLIVSGFHEATLAARAAYALARDGAAPRFQYTTSSSELHKRLKVA